MTTIAYKDGKLAGDTKLSRHDTWVGDAVKVWKNYRGQLCGVSGSFQDITTVREWFLAGAFGEPEQNDSHGILIDPDGAQYSLWGGTLSHFYGPFSATGSGSDIAFGAMAAGATAEEAVRIACQRDNGTGGGITVVSLEDKCPPAPVRYQPSLATRVALNIPVLSRIVRAIVNK